MKIQEVETLVGITKKNIRFYEQEGLLHPSRKENGYRDYSLSDVEELKKIKFLRSLSFPLEEIRQMQAGTLTVADGARRHLIVLEREQHSLEKAKLLCSELIQQPQLLEHLDTDALLEKMQEKEKEGAVFMNGSDSIHIIFRSADRTAQYRNHRDDFHLHGSAADCHFRRHPGAAAANQTNQRRGRRCSF